VADIRPSGRFSAHDRVRKRTEFLRIQQQGRRVVSPAFVFMLDRALCAQGPRLGITASRRVGNAVQRNRAKRLVREAFRTLRGTWPPVDVVVIVRQGLGNKTLGDVVGEWQAARGRILRRCAELIEPRAPGAQASAVEGGPSERSVSALDASGGSFSGSGAPEPRGPARGG
jgi:ribonuclease P protein component